MKNNLQKVCDSSCLTCNGVTPKNCLSCPSSPSATYLLSSNNSCVACNVQGYYADTTTGTCNQCDTTCLTCSTAGSTNCLTCPSGTTYLLSQNNSCVTCNVQGYYQDTTSGTCNLCDTTCQTCSASGPTSCSSCPSGTYLLSSNHSCVVCNVQGYYQDTASDTCNLCDSTCLTCSTAGPTNCLSCPSSPSVTYFLSSNNSCVACNVQGYYIDTTTGTCNQCDSTCLTCSAAGSTNCLTCPSGAYLDTSDNTCNQCDSTCQTCSASGPTSCLSCPAEAYLDTTHHTCSVCDSTCQTCNAFGPTDCLTCPSGTYLLSSNHSCVACNIQGYYANPAAGTCSQCDITCITCNATGPTNCLSCSSGTYLLSSNHSCIACNVQGYYINVTNKTCGMCDTSCRSCNGLSSLDCLSCFSGYALSSYNSCLSNSPFDAISSPVVKQAAAVGQSTVQVQSAATSILPILIRGASTTAILMVNFVSNILLFRFINVPFPDNFMQVCIILYTNFFPNPYNNVSDEYNITNSAIGKFAENDISTVVLDNEGNTLDRELIAIGIILIAYLLAYVFKKHPKYSTYFKNTLDQYRWNLLLTFYVGDCTDLVLFSMIQLHENSSQSWYAILGYFFSIVFIISFVILIPYFIYIVNRKEPNQIQPVTADVEKESAKSIKQTEKASPPKWRELPKSMDMISSGIKKDHWIQRNFLIIMTVEGLINNFVLFFLQDYGAVQACLYALFVVIVWVMGIKYKPYTTRLQNFLFIMNYTARVILCGFAIYIGFNGLYGMISDDGVDTLGTVMTFLTIGTIGANACIALVVIVIELVQWFKSCRKRKTVAPGTLSPFVQITSIATEEKELQSTSVIKTNEAFLVEKILSKSGLFSTNKQNFTPKLRKPSTLDNFANSTGKLNLESHRKLILSSNDPLEEAKIQFNGKTSSTTLSDLFKTRSFNLPDNKNTKKKPFVYSFSKFFN